MNKTATGARLILCCSLLLMATEALAQIQGTLFTKPEEREYLDYLRSEFLRNNAADDFNIEEADIPEIPDQAAVATEETGPEEYSFGGVMSGRDGIRIWLNGKLLAESELPEGFSIARSSSTVSLRIEIEGKTYLLLPGQTADLTSGTVIENFARPPAPVATETAPSATPVTPNAVSTEAPLATADEPAEGGESETPAIEESAPSFQRDDIDGAVASLSDAEAEELAAALERRRAAASDQPAGDENGDEP